MADHTPDRDEQKARETVNAWLCHPGYETPEYSQLCSYIASALREARQQGEDAGYQRRQAEIMAAVAEAGGELILRTPIRALEEK